MSGIFDQVINYAPPSLLKGTVTYKGTWSAATNTPTLINPPDSTTNGFYYVVSAAGTQFSLVFNIGDWIISNGSAWEKVDNTDAVSSVFGRTGAVVGVSTDYSAVGITATAVGASSPSTGAFTTLSATTPLAVASGGTGVASSTGTTNVVLSGSPTITTPVIAQINDANGNETLKLASIASAVNEVTIENAATGNAVHISATGGDASVGLHLAGKGASGYVNVQDSTDATKRIMFNAAGGTTNTRTMLSSTQTVDRILSLPDATDTLVGKATTDTLTNKTLTSPTITGGALNGTLGATTPSTIAATTVGATGIISSTSNNPSAEFGKGNGTAASVRLNPHTATYHNWSIDNGVTSSGTLNIAPSTAVGGNTYTTPVAYFTTTGLNSTAIGASSASTGAFSTLTSNNHVSTTNATYTLGTSSNKWLTAFIQTISDGATAAGALLDTTGTTVLHGKGTDWTIQRFYSSGNEIANITSTGAAITGTLSATGITNFGGGTAYSNGMTIKPASNDYTLTLLQSNVNNAGWGMYADTGGGFSLARYGAGAFSAACFTATLGGAISMTTSLTVTGTLSCTAGAELATSAGGTFVKIGSATALGSGTGLLEITFNNAYYGQRVKTSNSGGGNVFQIQKSTGAEVGLISHNDTVTVYGGTSDYRLKNITGAVTDSGTFIDALKPKVGTWKSDGSKFVGFIAHEFAEVSPSSVQGEKDAVDTEGNPKYQGMQASSSEVIANLVAELQSLRKRLAALESK